MQGPRLKPQVDKVIRRCKERGLRRTYALEQLIVTFLENQRPMTLVELSSSEKLAPACDKATVFRMLQRLMERRLVRRLGFQARGAYFELLQAERGNDYLICTGCGSIEPVEVSPLIDEIESEIQRKGFQSVYHELEFFGICPKCV